MTITAKRGTVQGYFTGTCGSTALVVGDLAYFDGTDWEKADADDNTIFAEAVVVLGAAIGGIVGLAQRVILVDSASGYTQGDQYFLSTTAGAITATRPTGATALKQVVGFGLSTSELRVEIAMVRELAVNFVARGATSAYALLDGGNFGGSTLDAQNETALFSAMEPENAVGIEIAYAWLAVEDTGGTPTVSLTTGSVIAGAQHDVVTADSTLSGITSEGTAPDEVIRTDISTNFDATNIQRAGALLGVKVLAADSGTDIRFCLGIVVVFLVV